MLMTKKESKFLLNNLSKNQVVLEWGSGESTIKISRIVKKIYSIEHCKKWFNKNFPYNTKNNRVKYD